MLDFLDKIEIIPEVNYNYLMKTQVEPYLEKRGKQGFFTSFDGKALHYEAYDKLLSRGNIIILHGFTESAEKFREIAYYFRKVGYSVFVPDLRGHGKSYRTSQTEEKVEIDSFDTYSKDLDAFIENVVKQTDANREIYIYSHSLGSTVALLYMLDHPYTVKRAVLSSPMICGNMGMPTFIAGTVAKLICLFGGEKVPAPGRCVFKKDLTPEESDAQSKARFEYYHEKRKNEPVYRTSGPSFGWVKASLEARDRLLDKAAVDMLKTQLLIFKPETDKQLLGEYTDKFAELADTKIKNVKNSRHEIFMSGNDTMEWYIAEVLEFFRER